MTSTHTVRVGGKVFAVQTGGAGIPLLLLHAFPLDHGMWEAQAPLAESVRMIVPDQRGFGRTPSDPPIASIAAMADDAVAVLDALHVTEPAFVWGAMSPSMLLPGIPSVSAGSSSATQSLLPTHQKRGPVVQACLPRLAAAARGFWLTRCSARCLPNPMRLVHSPAAPRSRICSGRRLPGRQWPRFRRHWPPWAIVPT
jgi:pimeloyl-ACP methyl ester carboxylesterase